MGVVSHTTPWVRKHPRPWRHHGHLKHAEETCQASPHTNLRNPTLPHQSSYCLVRNAAKHPSASLPQPHVQACQRMHGLTLGQRRASCGRLAPLIFCRSKHKACITRWPLASERSKKINPSEQGAGCWQRSHISTLAVTHIMLHNDASFPNITIE